jgi:parvulin-like peptidyl-prolyl isomerase
MTQAPRKNAQKRTPAARVNGVVISQYQVESGLQTILDPYRDTKGKVRLSQEQQYAARKQVIENLITRELLLQEGRKQGIAASEGEVNDVMAHVVQEYQTDQKFEAALAMTGLTPEEYRRQVAHDIIMNKFAASLVEGKRKPVTADEARTYYDEHIEEMTGSEARKILHVFTPLHRYAPQEEEQKARERLEKICATKQVFVRTVEQGEDAVSQVRGEDLGFVGPGELHPLLNSIAFRLPQGELSRIIRTEEGLHVLLVEVILEKGTTRPFDLIEEELKKKIYEMRSVSILNDYTDKLREKARIEIFDRMADNKLGQEKQGS